eukprot:352114-Chlamydomonas_euryale.AAC.7
MGGWTDGYYRVGAGEWTGGWVQLRGLTAGRGRVGWRLGAGSIARRAQPGRVGEATMLRGQRGSCFSLLEDPPNGDRWEPRGRRGVDPTHPPPTLPAAHAVA